MWRKEHSGNDKAARRLLFIDFSWLDRGNIAFAIEHHAEPGGTIIRPARTAGSDNPGFPVSFLLINRTGRLPAFGDVKPRGVRSRKFCDLTPGRYGHVTTPALFALDHSNIANGFGTGLRLRRHAARQQDSADKGDHANGHSEWFHASPFLIFTLPFQRTCHTCILTQQSRSGPVPATAR